MEFFCVVAGKAVDVLAENHIRTSQTHNRPHCPMKVAALAFRSSLLIVITLLPMLICQG